MRPIAYVVNLEHRKDRWSNANRLWSGYFDLVRVNAVVAFEGKKLNGAMGCKLSHLMLAEKYLKEHDTILVLEDDAEPTKQFEMIGPPCIFDAKRFFAEWDYINFGPFLDLTSLKLPKSELSDCPSKFFYKASYTHNTHMVMYNERTLRILKQSIRSTLPVDMFLGSHCRNQWVPIHLLARQYESKSDIRKPHAGQYSWYDRTEEMLTNHSRTVKAST